MSEPRLFLCHSSIDKEFVRRLAKDLGEYGVRVWFDEWELQIGDSLSKRVFDAIGACDYLAAVVSQSSAQSTWVEKELGAGLAIEIEARGVFVLPILKEPCEIPVALKDKKYADFTEDYHDGLEKLLLRVRDAKPHSLLTSQELAYLVEVGDAGHLGAGMGHVRPGTDRIINTLSERRYISMFGGSNREISLSARGFEAYYSSIDYEADLSDQLASLIVRFQEDRAVRALLLAIQARTLKNPAEPQFAPGEMIGVSNALREGMARLEQSGLFSVTSSQVSPPPSRRYLNRNGMRVTKQLTDGKSESST